ncbi:hypothetical protein SKAU_G00318830 [Synaphobranchus kaupii]|uniref:Uncharacterized protein n=1 Tax=Synaphobranchus kaupii TaxID=118154 RepID=A0A9Q1ET80_SYNKA|nr:hypothetical protein SKAU_G00318830 [Synaphobranchus kaupii]
MEPFRSEPHGQSLRTRFAEPQSPHFLPPGDDEGTFNEPVKADRARVFSLPPPTSFGLRQKPHPLATACAARVNDVITVSTVGQHGDRSGFEAQHVELRIQPPAMYKGMIRLDLCHFK